ncbi:MAG: autotransporter domain-containing protein [Alphaproteobacteria bacterium]
MNTNDNVNFLGSGILNIDSDITLGNVSSGSVNIGNLNIANSKNLSIANIGSSFLSISNISFADNSVLNLSGDIYVQNNILNANNFSGNINLTNNLVVQNFGVGVSSALSSLNEINITNIKGVNFSKDIYAKYLKLNGDNTKLDGTSLLKFSSTQVNENATFKNFSNVNFGDLTVASSKILNLDNVLNYADIINNSGSIILAKDTNLNITEDISGVGSINIKDSGGAISFTGSLSQNVENIIGLNTANIEKINVKNFNNSEIFFKNDVFVKNINFESQSLNSAIKIDANKTLNLSGDINLLNDKSATIYGNGTLNLISDKSQNIAIAIGKSSTNRLNKLLISTSNIVNDNMLSLNAESYITDLEVNSISNFKNDKLLNVTNLKINDNFNWQIGTDSVVNQIEFTNSKNLFLKNSNNLKISGDISGNGNILGSTTNQGALWFDGSVAQNIASTINIGNNSKLLAKISSSNISNLGVKFANDVYVNEIEFLNKTDNAKISIEASKSLNVAGNILQSGSGSGFILGDGILNLNGSGQQNIMVKIGENSANRLDTLNHNNADKIYLTKNIFANNFNFNQSTLKLAGNVVLDTNNSIDLSGKKIITEFANNNFGRINVNNDLNLNSSNFELDFSNLASDIDITGSTSYSLAKSNNTTGDISQISLTDNSYLFDGKLSLANNELSTSINFSDNYSKQNVGDFNFNLLNQVINQNDDVKIGLVSISGKSQLDSALESLKPIADEVVINNILGNSSTINNIVDNRYNSYQYLAQLKSESNQKNDEKSGVWWQIYNNYSKQNNIDQKQEYLGKNFGLTLGYDRLFEKENINFLFGSSLVFGQLNLANKFKNKNSDINFYNLVFYNHNSVKNTGLFNKNSLFLGFNNHNNSRKIEVGNYHKTANSNFKSTNLSAQSKIGYEFNFLKKYSFAAFVGGQYFVLNQNKDLEKNADKLNLNSKINSYKEIIAKIGFEASANIDYKNYKIIPNLGFSYEKNLLNNAVNNQFSFIQSNEINVAKSVIVQQNKYNFALGFDILLEDNQQLKFKSNAQISNNYHNLGGTAQYNWEF